MNSQFEKLSYEESLEQLERIVSQLRDGKTSLEEMVSLYENGAELYKLCYAKLEDAKQKVSIYNKETDTLEPFEEE